MADNNLVGNLLTTLSSLIFVLALAWLVLRMIKRIQLNQASRHDDQPDLPHVVHSVALGPRERLITISYQGKTMLLGVTAASIQRLDHPDEH
jgi:flagellar biogenesis protein FliO